MTLKSRTTLHRHTAHFVPENKMEDVWKAIASLSQTVIGNPLNEKSKNGFTGRERVSGQRSRSQVQNFYRVLKLFMVH